MHRHSIIYDTDLVIQSILEGKKTLVYKGVKVSIGGNRLKTYTKGLDCVSCGLVGKHFAIEKHRKQDKRWHLNLYSLSKRGNEIMMTSDHIIPRCKGGRNDIGNRQPMCKKCNGTKSHYDTVEEGKVHRKQSEHIRRHKKLEKFPSTLKFIMDKINSGDKEKDWDIVLSALLRKNKSIDIKI
jgi:5-methylcytosine-specific restriction endonuclease McrA